MKKVFTISLGGHAFQLEEDAHEKLSQYLDDAGAKLGGNPDKAEIIADLEQAIGEKLSRFLSAHKTVANVVDVDRVLGEMGPVDGPSTGGNEMPKPHAGTPKKLYRIREGAVIFGVCMGLAAYFDLDVTLVRIIFVALGIITSGGFILAYFIMMLLIPEADTEEARAAAHGAPFTAQELIARAKTEYANWSTSDWRSRKQEWKARMRTNKRQMRRNMAAGPMSPVLTILNVLLGIGLAIGIATLFSTHTLLGLPIPAGMPVWVAIVGFVVLYHIATFPLRAARFAAHGYDHESYYTTPDGGFSGIFDALSWFGFFAVLIWLAYVYVPGAHHFLDQVPPALARVGDWISVHVFHQTPQ